MKTTIYSILAAAACGMAFGQTAYTTPVGYVTVPLPGTGGVGTQKIQIANQGLLPSGSVEYAGVAEAITSTYVQDDQGAWSAGAYVRAGSLGPMVSNLVEITSGPLQGTMTWITSTTAGVGNQRLYTSDDISGAGATASFRVLKAYTVSTFFGAIPAATVLGGASTVTAADTAQVINPLGAAQTFWYKNAGGATTSWGWKAGFLPAGVGATDVPFIAIDPNDGLIIYRKQSGPGSLVVSGDVKTGNTKVRVEGDPLNPSVYNIIANQLPVDGLTISGTGLYTGNPATGIKGASTLTAADTIQIWSATDGAFKQFWYKNAGGATTSWGWKSSDLTVLVPADFVIPSANAVTIQRKNGVPFTWNIPAVNIAP